MGIKSRFWNEDRGVSRLIVYGKDDILKFKKVINPQFKRIEMRRARR